MGREFYCPYLQSRTDKRVCEWVHAEDHDTQKSKPIGQASLMMEIMGITKNNLNESNGRLIDIEWTNKAKELSSYEWGDARLNQYFLKQILGYGPIIALINILNNYTKKEFNRNELYPYLIIQPTNDPVNFTCDCGKSNTLNIWDGNTSYDAVTRSTATLLTLLAQTGAAAPKKLKDMDILKPIEYSNWLMECAKKGEKSFPAKWVIQKNIIKIYCEKKIELINGISYVHFIPKATDRNKQNKCSSCDLNLLNKARIKFGSISQNRKLLLIAALKKALEKNKKVDLEKLTNISLHDPAFYINKDTQLDILLNVERFNISLYGCYNELEDHFYLKPKVKFNLEMFKPYPSEILSKINILLSGESFLA